MLDLGRRRQMTDRRDRLIITRTRTLIGSWISRVPLARRAHAVTPPMPSPTIFEFFGLGTDTSGFRADRLHATISNHLLWNTVLGPVLTYFCRS